MTNDPREPSANPDSVAAGELAPWDVGDLPEPPRPGWRLWAASIGPGIVLAGTCIGTGEWLFGPAVSAQYGAALFWLPLISILLQAVVNLLFVRYALYCGEPINVGILRMKPGPVFWMWVFAVLEIGGVMPYNASNAAVPLAAAFLGHLPAGAAEVALVKGLGIAVFLLSFVPLVFGGTVYRMLEKIMTAKLVFVLGFLGFVAVTMVSAPVVRDVVTGFFRFGTVPLRPETLIVGRHFNVQVEEDGVTYRVAGSWEPDGRPIGDITILPRGPKFDLGLEDRLPPALRGPRRKALEMSAPFLHTDRFEFTVSQPAATLHAEGDVVHGHHWEATALAVRRGGTEERFASLAAVPEPYRDVFRNHLAHEGLAYVSGLGYVRERGRLPPLDWAIIVSFIGIAGAGGLSNVMFSNYARDKGWGMGARVGAIPSAFGGVTVRLSHTGCVFRLDEANRGRWLGWLRHVHRDQALWVAASVVGLALPCMMSLEFIRNASVTGDRVAAMSAEGIAARYPAQAGLLWFLTLLCGFLVLAPGQVSVCDQIARRWTDMIWTASSRVKAANLRVNHVYYAILAGYMVFGLVVLLALRPLQTAKIGTILQNISLGVSALLSLHVTRTLMPRELHPHWLQQVGVVLCGVFFIFISVGAMCLL